MSDKMPPHIARFTRIIFKLCDCLRKRFELQVSRDELFIPCFQLFGITAIEFELGKGERDSSKIRRGLNGLIAAEDHLKRAQRELNNLPKPANWKIQYEIGRDSIPDLIRKLRREREGYEEFLCHHDTGRNERAFTIAKALLAIYEHYTGNIATAGKNADGLPTGPFCKALEEVLDIVEIQFGFYEPALEAVKGRDFDEQILHFRQRITKKYDYEEFQRMMGEIPS